METPLKMSPSLVRRLGCKPVRAVPGEIERALKRWPKAILVIAGQGVYVWPRV